MIDSRIVPKWAFILVPAIIVAAAFLTAQVAEGAGVIVAILGATLWTAYVARKGVIVRAKHD